MGGGTRVRRCYFCGVDDPEVLEEHHVLPRKLMRILGIPTCEKITLCRNCHRKLHRIYDMLFRYLKVDMLTSSQDFGLRQFIEFNRVRGMIRNILIEAGEPVHEDYVLHVLELRGVTEPVAREVLKRMKKEGEIFNISSTHIELTDRFLSKFPEPWHRRGAAVGSDGKR